MANAINRAVEEVAKKQVEELIVTLEILSEQIIATSKVAKANQITFNTPSTSNGEMNKKLVESRAIVLKLQADYKNLQDSYDKLIKKVDSYTTAKKNNTQALTNNSISQSQLLKNVKEEEVKTSSLTTYIQKLSVDRIRASRIVADYNAQIAIGIKLTDQQTKELAEATTQFQKYDNAIKAGKKSIGDSREFVGQYERANIGLSNSIAQIARELPAATYGFQTFAVGISNNIPIAVDEIKKAVAINKELVAQGKETTSVFKQVGAAILSFNTIMSVAILLFTVYGKEIGEFFKEMFKGVTITNAFVESQKLLNEATKEAGKASKDETVQLKSNLAIAKDVNLSKKDRLIAVDKIIKQYPYFFEGLTNEEILAGKTEKAERKLTEALLARAKSTAAMAKITSEQGKVIDIDEKIYQLTKDLTTAEQLRNKAIQQTLNTNKGRGDAEGYNALQTNTNVEAIEKKIKSLKDEKKANEDVISRITDYVIVNDKLAIGLDDQTNKNHENTKSIKLNTKAREDYLASEYELLHLRLTNVTNANKAILDDDASSYELRTMAAEQYYQNLVDLANMEAREELRILDFSKKEKLRVAKNEFENSKNQLDSDLKAKKINQDKYDLGIKQASEQLQYDITGIVKENTDKQNIIYENQSQHLIEANKETIGELSKIWDSINFGKAQLEIGNVDLTNIQKLGEVLKGITPDMTILETQKALEKVSQIAKDNANDINKREAQLALDRAERAKARLEQEIRIEGVANGLNEQQIQAQFTNNQALIDADQAIIDSKKRVADADNATTQTEIDNQLRLKEETKRVNDAIYDGKIELYNSIKDLAGQLFENQITDIDNEIEKSNEKYDALLANAEKGSEQEQILLEEKQAKEEELQKRKIALQRKQALFNKLLAIADIGIKLQQEIANNNATFVYPTNLPINALSFASAAIRVGTVLATPIPQYEKGRDGGKAETALINEKVLEPVEDTDGTVTMYSGKNRVVNLKAGAIVHKSLEDFQKSKFAMENAAIMASFANQSEQLQRFDYYLGQQLNGMSDKMAKSVGKEIKDGFKRAKINSNVIVNNNVASNRNFRN